MKDNIVYWKMRNGRLISVDDMDINHLRNVLKMIIRNREKAMQLLVAKSKVEIELNSDIAKSFNDDNYSDLDDIQWSDGEFYKQ